MDKYQELFTALADWDPREFTRVPGSVLYKIEVPAHTFTNVIASFGNDRFVEVTARDYFSEELAAITLRFVLDRVASQDLNRDLQILQGFHCPGFKFDAVGLLGLDASGQSFADYQTGKTCTAFPMFRCEFTGDETAKLIDSIRHEGLCTIDWQRRPFPKLKMAFRTSSLKSERWGLGSLSLAFRVIEAMVGTDGSWIKLENFQGDKLSVRWRKSAFEILSNEEQTTCDFKTVTSTLEQFAVGANDGYFDWENS